MTVWQSLIQPKLDYSSQLWSPADTRPINLLEKIQRKFTSQIHGMREKDYWERLSHLRLYSHIRMEMCCWPCGWLQTERHKQSQERKDFCSQTSEQKGSKPSLKGK